MQQFCFVQHKIRLNSLRRKEGNLPVVQGDSQSYTETIKAHVNNKKKKKKIHWK